MGNDFDAKIQFRADYRKQVDFKIRCEYEGLNQSKFFRLMIDKMLEKDERILSIIDEWKEKTKSSTKRRQEQIEKDRKRKEEFDKKFKMEEAEIRDLYDLFDD